MRKLYETQQQEQQAGKYHLVLPKEQKNAKKVPIPGAKNSVGNRNPLYLV